MKTLYTMLIVLAFVSPAMAAGNHNEPTTLVGNWVGANTIQTLDIEFGLQVSRGSKIARGAKDTTPNH